MRSLAVLCAVFSIALAWPALAQMMPAGQPPATPDIATPSLPADCVPGTQMPSCPPDMPRSAPAAPMRTSPPAGGGLITGFAVSGTADLRKVVSHFQRGVQRIDTANAFGFVVIPRAALSEQDLNVQRRFCQIMLASLDYEAPDSAEAGKLLMTYWPISTVVERWQIEAAFRAKNCDNLIAWYDHSLARSIADKADIAYLSGPLLVTWPSQNPDNPFEREPLVVDFANADRAHATKALRYWFRQLNSDPELWTNRIREGTIRAGLADAINDTAGVMLAVLYGKWDTVAAVSETP